MGKASANTIITQDPIMTAVVILEAIEPQESRDRLMGVCKRKKLYEASLPAGNVGYERIDFGASGHGLVATRSYNYGSRICPIICDNVIVHPWDDINAINDDAHIQTYALGIPKGAALSMPKGGLCAPIDATLPGWWVINHSCNPNTSLGSGGKNGSWIRATRPIKAGEQLTTCYGWLRTKPTPCYCGEEFCCGIMCPYINKVPGGVRLDVESAHKIITTSYTYKSSLAVRGLLRQLYSMALDLDMPAILKHAKLSNETWCELHSQAVILEECNLPAEVVGWLYRNNICDRNVLEYYHEVLALIG